MAWRTILGILVVPVVVIGVWYGITYFQPEVVDSPVITFEKEGNLIKDNPGFEKDIWYLVYDEPGQPGRAIPLLFDHDSQCGSEGAFAICNISFEQGERVRVAGAEENGAVHVVQLTYLSRESAR